MARCARNDCRRWRPDVFVRLAGIGLHVDGEWFCSPVCVESATEKRLRSVQRPASQPTAAAALRLGALLMHQGSISASDLRQALEAQLASGRRLGAEIQHLGFADAASVLRGLSAQAGVNYLTSVDPASVRNAPGGLSIEEVRALGLVPIKADQTNRALVVACQAPLPRTALSALRTLTGWTAEPLLVSDANWHTLMDNYGVTSPAPDRGVEFIRVKDVGAAAARVAAAATAGPITVTQAHCDSSMWVRIERSNVSGGIDTGALPIHHEDNSKWQAATTSL